ncbi:MAG: hypothetical protein DRJ05_20780 [Bacteroidetes bacterium]|nr:MAG: hypothetical protein DRJ05_20780 [Bacteroidota bacterium]
MTTAQRIAIQSPAIGLMVYDGQTSSFWYYHTSGWNEIGTTENNEEIFDADHNTYVTTEETANDNIIRFYIDGVEKARFDGSTFEQANNGSSVFIGEGAGSNDDLSDNENVFVGYNAGVANTTGSQNTANGCSALYSNTTAGNNTATGFQALYLNTSGFKNSAYGSNALYWNETGENNTAVGFKSLYSNIFGSENTSLGTKALLSNTQGSNNIAIGFHALSNNTVGKSNIAIGTNALKHNTFRSELVAIGDSALFHNGENVSYTYYGLKNTAIGTKALHFNTEGISNTAIGYMSLYSNTTNHGNTAIGSNSMQFNTTGGWNTAVGGYTLENNTIGNQNSALGYRALENNISGKWNTGIGYHAINQNTIGDGNTAVGYVSLKYNTTGEDNTSIGDGSLMWNTTGSRNTAIGSSAGPPSGNGNISNTTSIGYNAEVTSDNQIRIGNLSITSIGGFTDWTNVSDGRFKTNVKENVSGLDFIMKLRPITYNLDMDAIAGFHRTPDSLRLMDSERLKEAEVQIGFIAQEVEAAANELNFDFHGVDAPQNENSHYGIRYAEFVAPLVKAMQEQQAIIEELKKRIEQLEEK